MKVRVKIDNVYEDGVSVTNIELVDSPPMTGDLGEWWEEKVYPLTGTGRDSDITACYTATVLDGPEAGFTNEWVG